jgi:hypothetical protein
MAGLGIIANSANNAVGTGAKTQLQITAPANQGLTEVEASCDFDGQTAGDPKILVELLRRTTITGAGTSSALTLLKEDPRDAEAIQSTAQQNFSAEPTVTTTTVLDQRVVHEQSGVSFKWNGRIRGGEAIAIRTTPLSGTGPNATCKIKCKE